MKRHKNKKSVIYLSTPKPKEQERIFKARQEAFNKEEQRLKEEEKQLIINKDLLDDTLHEIIKINNQIKANSLEISKTINSLKIEDEGIDKHIHNTLKTLEGNASLLSIRMDAYGLAFNPTSSNDEMEAYIGVYGKVEKVYKCLYYSKKSNDLSISLIGNSDRKYRLRDSIELAFFIIIENAIKYSPHGSEISITFIEDGQNLNVVFENYAICPSPGEIPLLTERGYRSNNVRCLSKVKGNGLGLFLLKTICDRNKVAYDIQIKDKSRKYDGRIYNTFCVILTFSPNQSG